MKLTIGFSPCPNDTFIFDAMINGKIDTGDLQFEAVLEDVETLNSWALEGKLDISKLSYPAFFGSLDNYILLDAGSAMGRGVGPLLISKQENIRTRDEIEHSTIAIPGIHTTANLLLGFAFPRAQKKKPMVFSSIEDALLKEETELGVIIHENRFTYEQKGLNKVMDLGEYWESRMHIPLPLGGIAIKKTIERKISLQVNKLIKQSVEHAFSVYPLISSYVNAHAQTMSEEVMRKHIDLYVNEYSKSLGEKGKEAIRKLHDVFTEMHGIKQQQEIFLQVS